MIESESFLKGTSTIITVLDRINCKVKNTTIKSLYDELKQTTGIESNKKYQILNESGFQTFTGIICEKSNEWATIFFSNDTLIECNPGNQIKKHKDFIKTEKLCELDSLDDFLTIEKIGFSKGKTSEFFGITGMNYQNDFIANAIINKSI